MSRSTSTRKGWCSVGTGARKAPRVFVTLLLLAAALPVSGCNSSGSSGPDVSRDPTTSVQAVESTTTTTTTTTTLPATTAPTTTTTTTTVPEADVDPAVRIQRALDDKLEGWPAPGLMLWVDTPKRVIVATAGWADRELQIPMEPEGSFYTGSITKMFVATVVMQMVEEGLIGLDDPLSDWFPDVLDQPDGDLITIRHLLAHKSGLRYFGTIPEMRQALWGDGDPFDPRAVAETMIRDYSLEQRVGRLSYSNTNYTILGVLIEEITGLPVQEVIRERILDPLGMDHTYLATYEDPIGDLLPTYSDFVELDGSGGFVNESGVLRRVDPEFAALYFRTTWTSGGMVSNAPDLIVFARALFKGELFEDPATLDEMLVFSGNGSEAEFGLGVMRAESQGVELLGHFGHSSGHVAGIVYSREYDCAIVVMANSDAQSGDYLIRMTYLGLMALESASS